MVKWYGGDANDYEYANVSLWIFDESLLKPSIRPAELVWRMEMTPAGQLLPIRELVLVNAETGDISLHFNQVDTAWGQHATSETKLAHNVPLATTNPSQPPSTTENMPLQAGNTWYVATTGNDANSCAASASPCATIQGAIDKATSGDTIFVTASTYTGNSDNGIVDIRAKPLTISGGWNTTFTSQSGFTTIDGQHARRGIYSIGENVYISRVIIENGYTAGNMAGVFSPGDGGGVYGNPILQDCIIRNNQAENGGGVWGNPVKITNCSIYNNSAIYPNFNDGYGGGVYEGGNSDSYIVNSTIYDNFASTRGGGVRIYDDGIINNTTIVNNHSQRGGGIDTIFSGVMLRNSIVANNTATIENPDIDGPLGPSHNNIFSTSNPLLFPSPIGKPEYFPLLSNSVAIGAGNLATCAPTDQRGVARPQGGTCDAGAFEYMVPGPMSKIDVLGDNSVFGAPGYSILYPIQVFSMDSVGNPASGASINLSAPVSGASGVFADTGLNTTTVITDQYASATSASFTPNNQLGTFNINITSGVADPALFTITTGLRYVSISGSDAGNTCVNSAVPCATINTAIANANPGEGIRVTAGVFTSGANPIVTVNKDVIISGGWNSDFTAQSGQTILDGQNARQNVLIGSDVNTAMYDLTIQNGYSSQGAGIYNEGSLTIENVTIANNRTFNDGGGIYQKSGQLNLKNVTISNNTAYSSGGGIYIYDGMVTINNSTIAQNFASESIGGGLSNYFNKPVTVRNTIIAGNSADTKPDCRGQITSAGNNLIGFADDCDLIPAAGDLIGTVNSPVNALLGNLADNGGGTLTHALLTGSPAIDAGNFATCASADQRGVARPQGASCDIGAYEGSAAQTISVVARTYSADYDYVLPGLFLCDQTDPTCTEDANPKADKAHQFALGTYEMYLNEHSRSGIDQNNMPIISTVDYCSPSFCPYSNAFWTGGQVVYGDTYSLADDVAAHELTHGVTQYESGLFYYYQSGAINESFSDVWGEYYDQTNGLGNDSAGVKWLVGEDATGAGPFRSMSNPPAYGDPDKMTSSLYNKKVYYDDFWDNGGIHSNSGVNNKAVFLMVDGGTFNSKTVTALGWDKVIQIYYEVQTNLLSSGADYSDLYYAVQQACTNLTGQYGITAADCAEVKDALDAVQMNLQPVTNFNPDAPLCPTGMVTNASLTLFEEDFENGLNPNYYIFGDWSIDDFYSNSPIYALWGDDETPNSTPVFMPDLNPSATTYLDLPAGSAPFLHFKHAFAFEYYGSYYYDGGILEYQTSTDTFWKDIKPLFSAGQNYKGTISNYFGTTNSLAGYPGFVGDSHGYVSTRYDLKSLAGQAVRFRWNFGTDGSYSYFGWFLDDVRIYTCTGTPAVPTLLLPKNNALLTDYTPLLDWNDAASAAHYELQIATDVAFTTLVYNEVNISTSQFDVPAELTHNAKYYWRVRGVNGIGEPGNWSVVWYFRTALTPPTLVLPAEGSDALTLRPTFDWNDVAGATGYTIQISKNNTFTQIVHTGNPTGSSYTPTVDLVKNTLLYWRVQTKGANGPSAWSAVRSFTSANSPSTPNASLPANNALITNYLPLFKWSAVTLPTGTTFQHYQLQVDDNANFSSPELDDTSISDRLTVQFQTVTPLADNTKFYWRVRAVNTDNEVSNWSVSRYFRTALVPPTLASPVDGFTSMELRPTFDWNDVAGATGYTIQISKNNTFTQIVHTGNPTGSSYTPTADLPKNMTLYWRVLTKGANGPSAYSTYRSLTTPVNPPPTVSVLTPASNFLTSDYTPTFTWKAVVMPAGTTFQNYILQVDDDPAFGSPLIDENSLFTTDFTPVSDLPSNAKFYWRVRAVNTLGELGNWSAARYFRTIVMLPTLLIPADGGTVIEDQTPTFDWTDATGPAAITGYTIQISTSPTFSTTLVNATTVTSTYTPIKNLPTGNLLYWRVRVNGANGPSAWSSSSFTIQP